MLNNIQSHTEETDSEKDDKYVEHRTSLISRNITVMKRRTSVRLEPEMWMSLREIAEREQCSIHDICTLVSVRKGTNTSLTAGIRVFLMLYFRSATTEKGHIQAGHGNFEFMKQRAHIRNEHISIFSKKRKSGRPAMNNMSRQQGAAAYG